jgi:hypothetical protein
MKVTAVCPNCKEEIGIDGIKLVIDGSKTDVKTKLKSYIGWGDNNKAPVAPPAPTPPNTSEKELSDTLDQVIKKTPPTTEKVEITHHEQETPPIRIYKPLKLPEDNLIQNKPTDVSLSTSTIDAIGREIAKRISEFKAKGICLICNINQGNKENLICDKCLQELVTKKVQQEHKEEERKPLIW